MRLRATATSIDRVALAALAALVLVYSFAVGDAIAPSAGWAWLAVAAIALGANAARLRIGARPSEAGVAVGCASLLLALLRITGIVREVTLPIAVATVALPLMLVAISRRRSALRRRS